MFRILTILLDHDNSEVVYYVCGILINLSGAFGSHEVLEK